MDDAVKDLMKSLEAGMYYGYPHQQHGLRTLLGKLKIKSAMTTSLYGVGGALQVEDLEATLEQVTFDDGKLKLWKP